MTGLICYRCEGSRLEWRHVVALLLPWRLRCLDCSADVVSAIEKPSGYRPELGAVAVSQSGARQAG